MRKIFVFVISGLLFFMPMKMMAKEAFVEDVNISSKQEGMAEVSFVSDLEMENIAYIEAQIWTDKINGDNAVKEKAVYEDGRYVFHVDRNDFQGDVGTYSWRIDVHYIDDMGVFSDTDVYTFEMAELKQESLPVEDDNKQETEVKDTQEKTDIDNNRKASEKAVMSTNELTISDIKVKNEKTSYTITATVSNNVTSVFFPTWTEKSGQDDLIWHPGKVANNQVSCTIDMQTHDLESGNYISHIYVYDMRGNGKSLAVDMQALLFEELSISNVAVKNNNTSYTVTADIKGSYMNKVEFPTWTDKNGQDDIVWGIGSQNGTKFSYTVNMSDHNYESGKYITHIYAYSELGKTKSAAVATQTLALEEMAISNVNVVNNKTTYTITADVSDSYINKVSFATWTEKNGQDDLTWKDGTMNGNKVSVTIDMKDHAYEDGNYLTHIYVYDIFGKSKAKAVDPVKLLKDAIAISNVAVANNGTIYTVSADVSGSYISKASFPTWTVKNGQDDVVWKDGTINNGKVSYTVDMKDHNYEDGDYLTHIYVYNAVGQSKSAAVSATKLQKDPITITNVAVVNNGTTYTVSANVGGSYISKASFPTWTEKNGQDDVVWKDGIINNGTVSYTVDMKDHAYEDGKYLTHIYVYNAAGQSKSVAVSATELEKDKITISNVAVVNNGTTYTVSADVSGSYLHKASFPTWTAKNGQDDLVWKDGTLRNGKVSYTVDMKDHAYEEGSYLTHIYVYSTTGSSKSAAVPATTLKMEGIAIKNIAVVNNNTSYTIIADVSGSYINKVSFPTWTIKNGQDDVIWKDGTLSNGKVSYTVQMKDHKFEEGDYLTHIYVYNVAGQIKSAAVDKQTLVSEAPVIKNIVISEVTSQGYLVTCEVSDNLGIREVFFPTWSLNNGQDDLTYEKGTINGNTVTYRVDVNDHNYDYGQYMTHIYAYNLTGKRTSAATKGATIEGGTNVLGWSYRDGNKQLSDANWNFVGNGKLVVDVSEHNGYIDWVAAKKAGVDAVILRSSFGYADDFSERDKMFAYNVGELNRLGIPYGIYHFTYARYVGEGTKEALYTIRCMQSVGARPTLPIYYDLEYSTYVGNKDAAFYTQISKEYCETIKSYGYTPGIYANYSYWTTLLTSPDLSGYVRWIAHYGTEANNAAGTANPNWHPDSRYKMWQYSSCGNVSGFNGDVDVNILYN